MYAADMSEERTSPGSDAERERFKLLQQRLPQLFTLLSNDPRIEQTVVVIPSLSMDPRELKKITGFYHYEERMLVNLMLLRQARTRMVYVTSQRLAPTVVDYYLSMLPGIPYSHARRRLVMLDCDDRSARPLSEKILERPRLLHRIRTEIRDPMRAHMVCFNSSDFERTLAVALDLPLHSVDPDLSFLGTKSGCRETFREAGIELPFGFERLRTPDEMAEALYEIKRRDPETRRAVVKLNEGFSGEGNALFHYGDLSLDLGPATLRARLKDALPSLRFEAPQEDWESFSSKYADMGGVVESFVEGETKVSPSAQCRVNAIGEPHVISTHDQVLGGPSGQVFLGCTFPAHHDYRMEIQEAGQQVANVLASKGVVGRFAVDFVSVAQPDGSWKHFAIEVNLRKGGTTHPFLTLKFLTGGEYNRANGSFYSPAGIEKYYFATDTIQEQHYIGLRPDDLLDIVVYHGLHFHGSTQRGVVFHLIGALSEFGKIGLVAIGDNPQQAHFLHRQTLQVLDEETGPNWHPRER